MERQTELECEKGSCTFRERGSVGLLLDVLETTECFAYVTGIAPTSSEYDGDEALSSVRL